MALTWHEDAGDSMQRDLALGEAISIVKKHKEQHGEPVEMTVRRKRGGKRAQNRMNRVVVLNLHFPALARHIKWHDSFASVRYPTRTHTHKIARTQARTQALAHRLATECL